MKHLLIILVVNLTAILFVGAMHDRSTRPAFFLSLVFVAALVVFDVFMIRRARKTELISTPLWQFLHQYIFAVLFCFVCLTAALMSVPALVTGHSGASDTRQALIGAGLGAFILVILRRAWRAWSKKSNPIGPV